MRGVVSNVAAYYLIERKEDSIETREAFCFSLL